MWAGVLHGPLDLRVEERPDPSFGESDLLIEVALNGLCGTDATEFAKGPLMVPLYAQHPGSRHQGPTILGHEFVGTVVDAGRNVRHRIGERVACGAGVSCGHCAWCHSGRTNLCDRYYTLGLSTHGGLAEYACAPAFICERVPDEVGFSDAVLAQPLAVGIHSLDRAGVQPGDLVALLGVGAIGSFICTALGSHDGPVVAFDTDEGRLSVAQQLGVSQTHLIPMQMSPHEIRSLLPQGAHVVFETAGVLGSAERALSLARKGGRVVLVGLNGNPQALNLADIVLREIDVRSTVAHVCQSDLPAALDLLSRRQLADILPVRVIALHDVVSRGLEPLASGMAHGKIAVTAPLS